MSLTTNVFLAKVYQDLVTRLFAQVQGIKTVRLFNNQFETEKQESSFDYPCVFIEFVNLNYIEMSAKLQSVDLTIRFHIGYENLSLSQGGVLFNSAVVAEEIGFLVLRNNVFKALTHFQPYNCSEMMRTNEQLDSSHENVYVMMADYITSGIDDAKDEVEELDTTTINTLEIGIDLIIDNEEIRTGVL